MVANPTGVNALAALPKGLAAILPIVDNIPRPAGANDPTSSGANKLAPAVLILPCLNSSAANPAATLGCPKTLKAFSNPFPVVP